MPVELRPGDIVEVLRTTNVGRGTLHVLEAGELAMVRFVDDDVCVVLAHGLYVHLPLQAVELHTGSDGANWSYADEGEKRERGNVRDVGR